MVNLEPFELATDSLVVAGIVHFSITQFDPYSAGLFMSMALPVAIVLAGTYSHLRLPFSPVVLATGGLVSLGKVVHHFWEYTQLYPETSAIPLVGMLVILGLSIFSVEEGIRNMA